MSSSMWLTWKDLAWSELVVYNQEKWFSLVYMGPSKKLVLITSRRATNLWFNPKIRTNRELLTCSPDPCCNHSPDLCVPFLLKKNGGEVLLKFSHFEILWKRYHTHCILLGLPSGTTQSWLRFICVECTWCKFYHLIFCWVPFFKNAFHLTWWRRQEYSQ